MKTDWISANEAGQLLGITDTRVRQLARQGRIGRQVCGVWVFSRREILAFAKIERPVGAPRRAT